MIRLRGREFRVRHESCPCGSGKKFKKCCLPRQANGPPRSNGIGSGLQRSGFSSHGSGEPSSPTFWSHPPSQPDAPPPAGGEWVEYVFVKGKGWTHENQLKPGDQYRLKGGGWGTVEPERVISTTQEHPFYVQGKGWTPLAEIRPGDWIRTTDNGWVRVTKIEDTGRYETVYNLQGADYHTYFVGGPDWEFAVWAHNTCWWDNATGQWKDATGKPVAAPTISTRAHGGTAAEIREATINGTTVVSFKSGHGYRGAHGWGSTGLSKDQLEQGILQHLSTHLAGGGTVTPAGSGFSTFSTTVGGHTVNYRAVQLPSGEIQVPTYYP
ncbi:MAG: SEC-C domain-containing protein [Isosphaeraceae bacterium]|nr:SEC-C domain-containing protein [Isosphaeraceae bacterium]